MWFSDLHGRGAVGLCAGQCLIPADGWRRNDARRPHTAHGLHAARICYRCHPFYGVEVEVIRQMRRSESAIWIVKPPGGSQIAVPEWMLIPEVCDRFTNETEPRISTDALFDLRRLIDANRAGQAPKGPGCAECPPGGGNAQRRKSVRVAT